MGWLYFIIGLFVGGFLGVALMCILYYSRDYKQEKLSKKQFTTEEVNEDVPT